MLPRKAMALVPLMAVGLFQAVLPLATYADGTPAVVSAKVQPFEPSKSRFVPIASPVVNDRLSMNRYLLPSDNPNVGTIESTWKPASVMKSGSL